MRTCVVCRFATLLDDCEILSTDGWSTVCTRCYHRLTDTTKRMERHFREDVAHVLEEAPWT